MNQRGEATLFCILILVTMTGLLTLCGLKLQKSFSLMEKRSALFLCAKETKEELHRYLVFMGRTNWALKNTSKAQLIALLIPGLQSAALNADKIKRALKALQNSGLVAYWSKVSELKNKGCPVDPRLLLTPYELNGRGYKRGIDDRAILKNQKWTYLFLSKPYVLSLGVQVLKPEAMTPRIEFLAEEKAAKLSSLLSFR